MNNDTSYSLFSLLPTKKATKYLQGIDDNDKEWLRNLENQLDLLLYISYLEARKGGKRQTFDEHLFEVNIFTNIRLLRDSILLHHYKPLKSAAHIIFKPVIREIFAAPFRDRVVHHLIFMGVYEWWDRRFNYDSYSCRIGKGVLFGIKRLEHHIESVKNQYGRTPIVAKFDIQGFFMSMPRAKLYERAIWGLDQQFKGKKFLPQYQLLKYLWREIIFDDPARQAIRKGKLTDWDLLPRSKSLFCQPKGFGIVIGNLTSQLLSNIYLDQLDRFITQVLGYKHYGRYVDDFYIVIDKSELKKLKCDVKSIENFLKTLDLTLHPKKLTIRPAYQGIDFLGARVYDGFIIPGRRLTKNMVKAFQEVASGKRDITTVPSYLGHAKYMNSYQTVKRAFALAGWDYNPEDNLLRPHRAYHPRKRSTSPSQ